MYYIVHAWHILLFLTCSSLYVHTHTHIVPAMQYDTTHLESWIHREPASPRPNSWCQLATKFGGPVPHARLHVLCLPFLLKRNSPKYDLLPCCSCIFVCFWSLFFSSSFFCVCVILFNFAPLLMLHVYENCLIYMRLRGHEYYLGYISTTLE